MPKRGSRDEEPSLALPAAMSKAPGAGPSEQPPPAKPAHEAEEAPTAARGAVAGSVGALVSVAVLKTQLTANIFHNGSGPATPTAFSLLSTVVTTLILIPVFCGWRSQWTMLSWRMLWPDVAIIVAFTAADLGFTNIALSQLSVAVQQCIASTNPALTVLIESVYQRRLQHWVIYVVLLLLVTGAVLATKFSAATEVTGWGVLTACIAVSCSASKYVFAHGIMKKYKGALGSLALLFWLDVLMVPIYLVWTSANGELVAFFSQQLDALGWTSLLVTSAATLNSEMDDLGGHLDLAPPRARAHLA